MCMRGKDLQLGFRTDPELDGSHTTALRGGECCGYQGRKKRKTTNFWVYGLCEV